MRDIVIATGNPDKFREIKEILSALPLNFLPLKGISLKEESGKTLEENAIEKAEEASKFTGKTSIADDTGLEVLALNGLPGVYSARFAGPSASYEANRKKLLTLLGSRPLHERKARFRTMVAIAGLPGEPTRLFEGKIKGHITQQEKGEFGFGYDSIFLVPELGKTFAEIPPHEKNQISHRALALLKLKQYLKSLIV